MLLLFFSFLILSSLFLRKVFTLTNSVHGPCEFFFFFFFFVCVCVCVVLVCLLLFGFITRILFSGLKQVCVGLLQISERCMLISFQTGKHVTLLCVDLYEHTKRAPHCVFVHQT